MSEFTDSQEYEIASAERMIGQCVKRKKAEGKKIADEPDGLLASIQKILESKQDQHFLESHASRLLNDENHCSSLGKG